MTKMKSKPAKIIIKKENLPEVFDDDEIVSFSSLKDTMSRALNSDAIDEILRKIVDINKRYGNSWIEDGVFINFGDISDKLSRLEIIINEEGKIKYTQDTMDSYSDVIFDLFVRALLTMLLDRKVQQVVKDKFGIDLESESYIYGDV